jgi:predicted Ser/Thr protein kinase
MTLDEWVQSQMPKIEEYGMGNKVIARLQDSLPLMSNLSPHQSAYVKFLVEGLFTFNFYIRKETAGPRPTEPLSIPGFGHFDPIVPPKHNYDDLMEILGLVLLSTSDDAFTRLRDIYLEKKLQENKSFDIDPQKKIDRLDDIIDKMRKLKNLSNGENVDLLFMLADKNTPNEFESYLDKASELAPTQHSARRMIAKYLNKHRGNIDDTLMGFLLNAEELPTNIEDYITESISNIEFPSGEGFAYMFLALLNYEHKNAVAVANSMIGRPVPIKLELKSLLFDYKVNIDFNKTKDFLNAVIQSSYKDKDEAWMKCLENFDYLFHVPDLMGLPFENIIKTLRAGTSSNGCETVAQVMELLAISCGYEIICRVGSGTTGTVYKAYSKEEDINKAIKIIPEKKVNPLEAKVMSLLMHDSSPHPNFPKIYDAGYGRISSKTHPISFDESYVITMEYIEGETLLDAIRNGNITADLAKKYSSQLIDGLEYLRKKGIKHRDINFKNLMVDNNGTLKIMDFGIATDNADSNETPANRRYGGSSDLFSWGLITYEMFSGHHLIADRQQCDTSETYAKKVHELKKTMRAKDGTLKSEYVEKINQYVPKGIASLVIEAVGYVDPDKDLELMTRAKNIFEDSAKREERKKCIEATLGHSIDDEQYSALQHLFEANKK